MTWQAHDPHPSVAEKQPFYTYVCIDKEGEDYYAAFIVMTAKGQFTATVPNQVMGARGKEALPYHYTHDTLQEAKDWCVVELVKRRLDV